MSALPQLKSLDNPVPSSMTSSYTATIDDSHSEAIYSKDSDYDPYLINSFEPGDPDNPQVKSTNVLMDNPY